MHFRRCIMFESAILVNILKYICMIHQLGFQSCLAARAELQSVSTSTVSYRSVEHFFVSIRH